MCPVVFVHADATALLASAVPSQVAVCLAAVKLGDGLG